MTSTLETLQAARALLTPEGSWTQGDLARDKNGRGVKPSSQEAVCWCVGGAIARVATPGYYIDVVDALGLSLDLDNSYRVVTWNDDPSRTHAEVLAAFDAAIRACEENRD